MTRCHKCDQLSKCFDSSMKQRIEWFPRSFVLLHYWKSGDLCRLARFASAMFSVFSERAVFSALRYSRQTPLIDTEDLHFVSVSFWSFPFYRVKFI